MSDVLEFVLKLKDVFTSPLGKADDLTNKFEKSLDGLKDRLDKVNKTGFTKKLQDDLKGALDGAKALNKQLGDIQKSASNKQGGGGSGFKDVFSGNIAAEMAMKAAAYGKDFIGESIGRAMEFQKNSKTFEVLTGSATRGRELTGQLRELKQTTIMGASVYKNAQTMMGFQIGDKEVVKDLRMIGDIAMGDEDRMASLTLAFSQTRAAGKLMGQDLLQYINAGFNPLSTMSEKWKEFGFKQKVSVGQLRELGEKGKISADMVTKAFELATSKGGKFYGMMDQIGDTTFGKMQKLKGNWAAMQIDVGNAMLPFVSTLADAASDTLHWLNISKTAPETLTAEKMEVDTLVDSIVHMNQGNEVRGRLIDTLKGKYPDLFGNLDREKTKNEDLLKVLGDVNAAYDRRIKLAEYDVVSQDADKDIKELFDLAAKAKAQATYSEKHPGFANMFKYLSSWDRVKMNYGVGKDSWKGSEGDLTVAGLRRFAQNAIKTAGDLQGIKTGADQSKLIQENKNLVSDTKGFLQTLKDGKDKRLPDYLAEANKFNEASRGHLNDDNFWASYDFSKLKKLMGGGGGTGGNTGGGLDTSGLSGASGAITGGGRKQIIINVNKEMVSGGITINASGVQAGVNDMQRMVEEAFLRMLQSANAINDN
jgi:tape measure domain-containing protein